MMTDDKHSPFDAETPFDEQLAHATARLNAPFLSSAADIITAAGQHMKDRARTYDKPQGERSMKATVEAFAATTGVLLTEEQGWHFMALLKLVRSQQGALRMDCYEDGAAYMALMGEAAVKERGNG